MNLFKCIIVKYNYIKFDYEYIFYNKINGIYF